MKKGTLLILSMALMVWACEKGLEGPLGPTSAGSGTPLAEETPPGPSNPSQPTAEPSAPKGCNAVQLNRASIKSEVDCKKGARFYAEAEVTAGEGYFNVHLGGLNNGPILGPNTLGKWSKWYDLNPGSYTYTLAAETKIEGKVEQCDRHNLTFTVPECYTGCIKPQPPQCPFGPPIYSSKDCTYTCPPCVLDDPPKCKHGPAVPDLEKCVWVCPPCVLPEPPECPFGPPIPDLEACKYTCPPCVKPPQPEECKEPEWNEELCMWECCEMPTPPGCKYGPPTPHPVLCSWVCPPCPVLECEAGYTFNPKTCECECTLVCEPGFHLHPDECKCYCDPVGEPECLEQTWNEELCIWEGECPCEYTITAPKIGKVFCWPLVQPKLECQTFAPGTVPIAKIDGSSPFATMDADVVIQKKGGGQVCGKKKRYIVYQDVMTGDPLKSGWSHTTYCVCQRPN